MPEQLDRIKTAQEKVDEQRRLVARLEAQEIQFQTHISQFKAQLVEAGIDPKEIDNLIARKEQELEEKLTTLEGAFSG